MLFTAAPTVRFENVAAEAGLTRSVPNGGAASKQFIIETTGSGVAFIDYDNDGLLDVFIASGEGDTSRLYHNDGGGKFRDVTEPMGLTQSGWAQGVCAGDYDNDGFTDLFVTYWGGNHLYRNREGKRFEDVTERAHLTQDRVRYNTGCAFLDYDNDGRLDLFVANYLKFDPKTTPKPGANPYCFYREIAVNCGPRGLPFDRNLLYHANADGTFSDVSEASGIAAPNQNYALGVLTGDFNNDGLMDIYVACDQTPSLLYINQGNGKFEEEGLLRGVAFDSNGKALSGMGVSGADYEGSGWLSIFRSNFSDERETLYRSQNARGEFEDATIAAGLARNTRFVGWGCGFFDFDNDGWKDLLIVNGHVFPEVDRLKLDIHYKDRAILYRNLGNGKFEDISEAAGPGVNEVHSSRGAAFGDYDNDGRVEVLINNQNEPPSLLKQKAANANHWTIVKLIGVRSNRSGIGARVHVTANGRTQVDEVRSGGSYLSQNDLRLHFGLGATARIDEIRIDWPSGVHQIERGQAVDRVLSFTEKSTAGMQAFDRELNSIDAAHAARGMQAAVLLREAHPALARELFERSVAVGGPDVAVRYWMDTGDWEQAARGVKVGDLAQELLVRLAAERPAMAADLFRRLMGTLPAALHDPRDLLFVARNMALLAKADPALAALAAERIAGSVEPADFRPKELREKMLFVSGAYLRAFDPQRFAWRRELFAPWKDRLSVADAAKSIPAFAPQPAPHADLSELEQEMQTELNAAFDLPSQRGKVVLVNFWEPWCAPCKRERPVIEKLAREVPELAVIGVSNNEPLHDRFEVFELPVTLLFDRTGRIVSRLTGEQTEEQLRAAIDGIAAK
jgi:thiol-disulfide isomerase/thioredoxin